MKKTDKTQKLFDHLLKHHNDYVLFASRPMSIQRVEVVSIFIRRFLQGSMLVIPLNNNQAGIFLEKRSLEENYIRLAKLMLSKKSWRNHKEHYLKASQKLIELAKKAKDLKSDSEELLTLFNQWQAVLEDFSYYFLSPFWVEDILFPMLTEQIKNDFELKIITGPSKLFQYQCFQKELIDMKGNIDYSYLINKYNFLSEYSLREKLLDKKEIDRRYQEIIDNNLFKEIAGAKRKVLNNERDFKLLLEKLSPKLAILSDIVHDYVVIRTERIENYQIALVAMRDFFKKLTKLIAKKYPTFSYLDSVALTNDEIINFLTSNRRLEINNIKRREKNNYVLYYSNHDKEHTFIYNLNKIRALNKIFIHKQQRLKNVETITGKIVSSGVVSGLVRLVFDIKDFAKFKNGEVLVSRYTSPAFMPIIKKAVALITDEGGITSHAAIVARELKRPCVVGTKIATKAFKDGDLVEIDANKGVVKLIKSAYGEK